MFHTSTLQVSDGDVNCGTGSPKTGQVIPCIISLSWIGLVYICTMHKLPDVQHWLCHLIMYIYGLLTTSHLLNCSLTQMKLSGIHLFNQKLLVQCRYDAIQIQAWINCMYACICNAFRAFIFHAANCVQQQDHNHYVSTVSIQLWAIYIFTCIYLIVISIALT